MRDLGLKLRYNLDQNTNAEAREQATSIKHPNSLRSSLQDTPDEEKSGSKSNGSSTTERITVPGSKGAKETT
jgi:hypothetical protein